MSRTYVETSTYLLEDIDEMIREGFYHDRSEAVNDALRMLIKYYKVSKLHAKDLRRTADCRAAGSEDPGSGGSEG